MNSGTSNTASNSPRRFGGDRWPVLARLADVSGDAPPVPSAQAQSQRAAAGFVEYRVDSPDASNAEDRVPRPHKPRPHTFQSMPRRKSPILPDSDPFALPVPTLEERFAPLARFVIVFALVTAIGTSILNMSRKQPSAVDTMQSPVSVGLSAPARASLTVDPGADAEQSLKAAIKPDSTSTGPTASGPLSLPERLHGAPADVRTALEPNSVGSDFDAPNAMPEAPALSPAIPERLPAITPEFPVDPQFMRTETQLLPQVQTSEAPALIAMPTNAPTAASHPSIARLSGSLLPAPAQAEHDEDQQSIY